jgi:hypothetical protein
LTRVAITKVSIGKDGRLLVYARLPAGETFEFIYRAARGAYWDADLQALYTEAPRTSSYRERFRHIVEAVAAEYGRDLVLTDESRWHEVPSDVQRSISSPPSAAG